MYEYITRENINGSLIIELKDFPDEAHAEIAYKKYLDYKCQMIYIEDEGVLIGVVSIGDVERYYSEKRTHLEINSNFSFRNFSR